MNKLLLSYLALIFTLNSCKQRLYITNTTKTQIAVNADSIPQIDSSIYKNILPYKIKLDSQVKAVIGYSNVLLIKEKPEGTLCNMSADAVLDYANLNQPNKVDFAVLNYGGLRISSIGKGAITIGKILELMPFDNELVILTLNGRDVRQLFTLIGENEGWPISNASCILTGKMVSEIQINHEPLQDDKQYRVATSDYLANGGDNAMFLKNSISRTDMHIKIRDAISNYIKKQSPLNYQKEGRIILNTK